MRTFLWEAEKDLISLPVLDPNYEQKLAAIWIALAEEIDAWESQREATDKETVAS